MRISPDYPTSAYAGIPATHTTYEGDVLEGVTDTDRYGRLVIRFPDGTWAFADFDYDTAATPEVEAVLAAIRADVREGLYANATAPLSSFTVLHDYVDANEYLDAACPWRDGDCWDDWNDRINALSDAVAAALAADPIPVA